MRRRRQVGDKRETLIEAAHAAFSDRDYQDVTVDDILEKAGVSRATFYGYFSSKEDIFLAVWTASMRDLRRDMHLPGADGPRISPRESDPDRVRRLIVERIAISIASWRQETTLKKAFLAFELLHPDLVKPLWEERTAAIEAAAAWVRRDAESGLLNDINPTLATMAIGLVMEWFGFHLVVMGFPGMAGLTDHELAEQLATLWLDGVYRSPRPVDGHGQPGSRIATPVA